MNLSLIVAVSRNGVIGRAGGMPWHLPDDLRRFKRLTMGHAIIMGRKTFQSIGRCLPGRYSVVVSRQPRQRVLAPMALESVPPSGEWPGAGPDRQPPTRLDLVPDFETALARVAGDPEPFVIGGAEIYRAALPFVKTVYLTRIDRFVEGDTHFPEIDWSEWRCLGVSGCPAAIVDEVAGEPAAVYFEVYKRRGAPAPLPEEPDPATAPD